MQHEAAIGLHRAAEIHRQSGEQRLDLFILKRNADAFEQAGKPQFHRAIDDDADRAILVVLADVGQRAGKIRVGHGGHGDQEMIGEIDVFHRMPIVLAAAMPHNLHQPLC